MHIKRRFSITKKYSVIYADPPWRYERSKVQGAAEKHYPTMGIDELCALPQQVLNEVFVQRLRHGNFSFRPAGLVEQLPRLFRQIRHVAGVEPDAAFCKSTGL